MAKTVRNDYDDKSRQLTMHDLFAVIMELKHEVKELRAELGQGIAELRAAQTPPAASTHWLSLSRSQHRTSVRAQYRPARSIAVESITPASELAEPSAKGMPPFAWALLILGLFCNGLGGHLEVAQTDVSPY